MYGRFDLTIGGQPLQGLVKLNKNTGLADPNWNINPEWYLYKNMAIVGDWVYIGGSFKKIGNVDRPGLARVNKITGELDDWAPAVTSEDIVYQMASDGKYLYVSGSLSQLSQDKNNPGVLVRYNLGGSGKPVLDLAWGAHSFSGQIVPFEKKFVYFVGDVNGLTRLSGITGEGDDWNPVVTGAFSIRPTSRWVYTSVTHGPDNDLLNIVRLDTQTQTPNDKYMDPLFKIEREDGQYHYEVMEADGAEVYVATGNDYICIARNEKHCGFRRYIVDPPAPLTLDAFDLTGTGFTASWEPVHGADQYVVELTTEADNFAPNTFIAADGTRGQAQGVTVSGWDSHSLVFSGLDPNTFYVYRLQASNAAGSSDRPNVIRQSPSWYNTRIALDVFPSFSKQGEPVTLTATVSTTGDLPGGTVTFKIGTDIVGTAEVNADGEAVLRTGRLPVGRNMITAEYNGVAGFMPSVSGSCYADRDQVVVSISAADWTLIGSLFVMSSNAFDVLMLIARPAAGKSEVIRYLKNTPPADRLERFHIGRLAEIDDFPMLWTWFEEDDLLSRGGVYAALYQRQFAEE